VWKKPACQARAEPASLVQLEDAKLGEAEAEVEGLVTSGSSTSFFVGGQQGDSAAATVFENGVAADLVPGVKVEAEGKLDARGVMLARKVSFRSSLRLQAIPTALSATDGRNGTFKLLGITVHTDDLTEFRPASGQPIDLNHLGSGPVEVRGTLHRNGTDVVASALTILGVTVDASSAESFGGQSGVIMTASDFFAAVSTGSVVKARTPPPLPAARSRPRKSRSKGAAS
jgi:hypothetical protein